MRNPLSKQYRIGASHFLAITAQAMRGPETTPLRPTGWACSHVTAAGSRHCSPVRSARKISLRVPLLNHNGTVVGLGLVTVLLLAFAGGSVFKGRSGWCGTFCPLAPIQRTYGQAPLIVVKNGYCNPCVGCQKSCYDFNPRAAVFSDIYDEDPRHAAQRRLFMALLPGLGAGRTGQKGLSGWRLCRRWTAAVGPAPGVARGRASGPLPGSGPASNPKLVVRTGDCARSGRSARRVPRSTPSATRSRGS